MNQINRKIVLAARPSGWVRPEDFRLVEEAVPDLEPGQVRVRNRFLSLDPYQRGRMNAARSYAKPLEIGEVIIAATVGEVLSSASPLFDAGDWVLGFLGWQEHAVAPAGALQKLDVSVAPPSAWLGALGLPGVTAWMGMTLIGQPRAGDTVVVSAAAGAVGSTAGQLAKAAGANVVGIAGGPEKCRFVREELRFDAAIDYHAQDFAALLATHTPTGVDVYFENVGGLVSKEVFARLNDFARVPLCGLIAEYNGDETSSVSLADLLSRRIKVEGFICSDRMDRWAEAVGSLVRLYRQGGLVWRETIATGLEAAVPAFISMLRGGNIGKQVVEIE